MTKTTLPSAARLRELLDYDPDTGLLTWKRRTGRLSSSFNSQFAGSLAGTLRTDGYVALKVESVILAAHRVIWAWVHGEWPECVRHANRIDSDNRLENLYAATRASIDEERRAAMAKARETSGNTEVPA